MHEWPTHARADSSPTMTTSRSCHAPQSRQQNFQRVADCVGVCVYVCVCLCDSGEEILIEFMQLIYDMCFCGCGWESVSGIESVFMRVCVSVGVCRECIYAWVGYECVWLVVRNSFWANTHAQRQRKLRGISGSISIKLQHCNAASVSPAQRYHLQLKEQRQMKNFSQFSYRIDFRSKKGRARSLHWTRMSWKLTTCMRSATDKGCRGEGRAGGGV